MLQQQREKKGEKYDFSSSIMNAAALMYIFRLNSNFKDQVDSAVRRAVPSDFLTENSFGMPIRASDKCGVESVCLPFEKYMELVSQQRKKYFEPNENNRTLNIVLTSESPNIMEARKAFENRTDFPYRFVVNKEDSLQGSGWPKQYGEAKAKNDIMVSTFVALKLQLLSKHFVANCCSRFHEVMMDLFKNGCGAAPSPSIHCMQELEDEQFQLCCDHTGTPKCRKQLFVYRKYLEEHGNVHF